MRELTPFETAAMWHFHDRYAARAIGAIDFYQSLTARERYFISDMVSAIVAANDRITAATKRKRTRQ